MKFDDFKELTEEEQKAIYQSMDDKTVLYDDMEAERDSFKKENDSIRSEIKELREEMKKTKELNFTLARSISQQPQHDAEEILHDMFYSKK